MDSRPFSSDPARGPALIGPSAYSNLSQRPPAIDQTMAGPLNFGQEPAGQGPNYEAIHRHMAGMPSAGYVPPFQQFSTAAAQFLNTAALFRVPGLMAPPPTGVPAQDLARQLVPLLYGDSLRFFLPPDLVQKWPLNTPVPQVSSRLREAQSEAPKFISTIPPPSSRRVIMESELPPDTEMSLNAFNGATDVFLRSSDGSLLVAPGPRRTYGDTQGLVIVKTHVKKLPQTTDLRRKTRDVPSTIFSGNRSSSKSTPSVRYTLVAVGDTQSVCSDQLSWLRKRLRLRHENDTPVITNVILKWDMPNENVPNESAPNEKPFEIDIPDLHSLIVEAFPHWKVVYNPDIAPIIAIRRLNTTGPHVGTAAKEAVGSPVGSRSGESPAQQEIGKKPSTVENQIGQKDGGSSETNGTDIVFETTPQICVVKADDGGATEGTFQPTDDVNVAVEPSGGKIVPGASAAGSKHNLLWKDSLKVQLGSTNQAAVEQVEPVPDLAEGDSKKTKDMFLSDTLSSDADKLKDRALFDNAPDLTTIKAAPLTPIIEWMLRCERNVLINSMNEIQDGENDRLDSEVNHSPRRVTRSDLSDDEDGRSEVNSHMPQANFSPAEPEKTPGSSRTKSQVTIDLQDYVAPNTPFYTEIEEWLKGTIVITPHQLLIHGVKSVDDAELACFYIFPLIRRFLTNVAMPATTLTPPQNSHQPLTSQTRFAQQQFMQQPRLSVPKNGVPLKEEPNFQTWQGISSQIPLKPPGQQAGPQVMMPQLMQPPFLSRTHLNEQLSRQRRI